MLIRFSTQNYRSIGLEPLMLDFVSQTKVRSHSSHICPSALDAKILRNAVVYGRNSCGKSNVVKAISLMQKTINSGRLPQGITDDYCRAEDGLASKESIFEIQFELDGDVFDYGFGCILSEYRISSEWLWRLQPSKELIYSRKEGEIEWGAWSTFLSPEDSARKDIYQIDYQNDEDLSKHVPLCTFLSTGKRYKESSELNIFSKIPAWFRDHLQVISAGSPSPTAEFYLNDKTLDDVADVLSSFDTGITGLAKRQVSLEELDRSVDPEASATIKIMLESNPPKKEDDRLLITLRGNNAFIGIERVGFGAPIVTILETRHHNSTSTFQFGDESDGTQRLFDFMDILFSKEKNRVYVIDELDRSLHPLLTRHLVKLFNQVHAADKCQMLFTTHESSIMDLDCYRKDEIWFVDKDDSGHSALYSLADFRDLRNDIRLERNYLDGRFGGIPVLASLGYEPVSDGGE